jgi:hypothetical protein
MSEGEIDMIRVVRLFLAVGFVTLVGLCVPANAQDKKDTAGDPDVQPIVKHRINPHGADAEKGFSLTTGGTGTVTPAITYHSPGPVMAGTVHTYAIWYGNWNQSNGSDTPEGQQIVRDLLSSIGNSPYFNLNTTYSISGQTITGAVTFAGETTDTGTKTRLRDSDILNIVNSAITSGALPYDANGVYFVLTSSNVAEQSGFCTRYCGWHTAATPSAGHVRYSFVGNANRCLNACAAQTTSPNGNAGVDGMCSVISHELEEAVTDPDLNAWYDSQGAENADKCAWTFGHFQQQLPSGAWYNVTLGSRKYLIQRNLEHNTSGDLCKMDATHN